MTTKKLNLELYKACTNGDLIKVKECIEKGADVNFKRKDMKNGFMQGNYFPLLIAAKKNHLDIIKLLIENSAEVNAESSNGMHTALSKASEFGHKDIVNYLLSNGADVNPKVDSVGIIPLSMAILGKHTEVVKTLLIYGAYPSLKSVYNETPLDALGKIQGPKNKLVYDEISYLLYNTLEFLEEEAKRRNIQKQDNNIKTQKTENFEHKFEVCLIVIKGSIPDNQENYINQVIISTKIKDKLSENNTVKIFAGVEPTNQNAFSLLIDFAKDNSVIYKEDSVYIVPFKDKEGREGKLICAGK